VKQGIATLPKNDLTGVNHGAVDGSDSLLQRIFACRKLGGHIDVGGQGFSEVVEGNEDKLGILQICGSDWS